MRSRKKNIFIATCIIPTFVLFSLIVIYPTIKTFSMSFYQWSGISQNAVFIGFKNYVDLFKDRTLIIAFKNTIFLILTVPIITMTLSLFFAAILTQFKLKGKNFYRTVFFFPNVLALVVISILWSQIYHPTMGILNSFLDTIGLEGLKQVWLGDEKVVMWAIVMTMVWQAVGYYMVMYIAGIDGIPKALYEAATVDGASGTRKFFSITIPMLWEVIRTTIIFMISSTLNMSFIFCRVMTAGGPNKSSEVLLTYMYNQAFQNANFGYAMAIAVVIFIFTVCLALISNRLTERRD